MRVLAAVLAVAIIVYALILAIRAPQSAMPARLSKWIWILFIIALPVLGGFIFLIAYLLTNGDKTRPATPDFLGPMSRKDGPLAPDDDPDFLAKLEEELRHQSYDKKLRDHEHDEDQGEQRAD